MSNYWRPTNVPILSGWIVKLKKTPTCSKVKNEWRYTSNPPLCLRGIDREIVFLSLTNFKWQ